MWTASHLAQHKGTANHASLPIFHSIALCFLQLAVSMGRVPKEYKDALATLQVATKKQRHFMADHVAHLRHAGLCHSDQLHFCSLQDRVPPLPLASIRVHLENQLGEPLDIVFESLSEQALAAASLAQVAGVYLAECTGWELRCLNVFWTGLFDQPVTFGMQGPTVGSTTAAVAAKWHE